MSLLLNADVRFVAAAIRYILTSVYLGPMDIAVGNVVDS